MTSPPPPSVYIPRGMPPDRGSIHASSNPDSSMMVHDRVFLTVMAPDHMLSTMTRKAARAASARCASRQAPVCRKMAPPSEEIDDCSGQEAETTQQGKRFGGNSAEWSGRMGEVKKVMATSSAKMPFLAGMDDGQCMREEDHAQATEDPLRITAPRTRLLASAARVSALSAINHSVRMIVKKPTNAPNSRWLCS